MVKINKEESTKTKRLTDKELREVLLSLKKRAEKSPEEKGSFSVEVICSGKDFNRSQKPSK